jgi:hypothetical protein
VSQGLLPFDGPRNNRMAAPTKNSAPMITLSRALTGKAWNNKPPMVPGQRKQIAPATAKTMAKALINMVETPFRSTLPPLVIRRRRSPSHSTRSRLPSYFTFEQPVLAVRNNGRSGGEAEVKRSKHVTKIGVGGGFCEPTLCGWVAKDYSVFPTISPT